MPKHTQGPWKDDYPEWSCTPMGTIYKGCSAIGSVSDVKDAEFIARACLRHAELLECLEAAVARVELANKEEDPILSAWLPDAKRAIAKAKGD